MLHDGGKPHRIFLDPLRCPLDMSYTVPEAHVVIVHRGAPAEDIVRHEETRDDSHGDGNHCDRCKGQ